MNCWVVLRVTLAVVGERPTVIVGAVMKMVAFDCRAESGRSSGVMKSGYGLAFWPTTWGTCGGG